MKRHLVLFALTLLVGLAWAGTAAAQVVFSASSSSRTIRVEGLTEAVGPVVLTATTSGIIKADTEIIIDYGTPVVNAAAIASQTSGSTGGPVNCTATGCNGNISMDETDVPGTRVRIEFLSDTAFVAGKTISIFEVRVSGNAQGCGGTVNASVSAVTPSADLATNLITFVGPTSGLQVAKVFAGPNSAPSGCSSTTVLVTEQTPDLKTCVRRSQNEGVPDLTVAVTENFAEALTSLSDENQLGDCNHLNCSSANNGSNIAVTFNGLPAGTDISFTGQVTGTGLFVTLIDVSGTAGTTKGCCSLGSGWDNTSAGPVSATFTFSVDAFDDNEDALTVILGFSSSNDFGSADPTTGLGVTTTVSLVPTSPVTKVVLFAKAPANTQALNASNSTGVAFLVDNCVTNLLFPFVANTLGFDTGIAIANTTLSPWTDATLLGKTISTPGSTDTEPVCHTEDGSPIPCPPSAEHGNCILNLFPSSPGGFAGSPVTTASIAGTTPDIPAGGTWADVLSDPAGPFHGKQGYVIAVCDFEFAHGFAFITNNFGVAAPDLAEGYLALVIPDPTTIGHRAVRLEDTVDVPGGEGLLQ